MSLHMTVEQALSVYPLSEGKLIADSKGKNRIISSVNVMDAPDITDWIKEGEMLRSCWLRRLRKGCIIKRLNGSLTI
ncbi:hypothetical protein [Paenibacillus harenae]|uniref:hypothetical protein n=1 Tax=Paenibacillus harenae TaxID=306543 RepID=UPI00278EED6C|nr:hypothetical protein [Paenibacillus harenae]MDQ0059811.1 hypothetical protein [Paenibacillus harenae]